MKKTIQRRVKNTIILYAKQKMLEEMITEQILEKERNNFLMVEILSNIVEFRNGESGLHVLHIRTITELLLQNLMKITNKYPLKAAQIALIVNASSLHDIGKISIPENILNKPDKLTPEEFEVMKTHSIIGAQILKNAPCRQNEELVQIAHDICRWHHERYDGGGYPDGLIGDEIPIAAQVVSLADAYDALTNVRIYKPAYSHETAMRMILNGECDVFNPILQQCLIEIGPYIAEKMAKSTEEQILSSRDSSISAQVLKSNKASNRTLALLEQERIKYQFFASMSKEIQYEYNVSADMLTVSEWGAAQLGLDEVITHPKSSKQLSKVLCPDDLQDFCSLLQKASPENPIIQANYCLNIHGQQRWYKVVARPLWVDDEHTVLTGVIGKFSDIHEERLQLETLKQRAEQDALTKLHNHMSARGLIEKLLAQEKESRYAVILIDLDLFKHANDQYGHMFGDAVLKETA